MVSRFQVGTIVGTHGLQGEVKVFPVTDDPERFRELKNVYLVGGREEKTVSIAGVKFSGRFVLLKFSEIDSIEEAQKIRGEELEIDRADAVPLGEGEYYIPDLIGLTVMDENGKTVGTLSDVVRTGANDCYEITKEDGKKFLIPAITDCIKEVNPEQGFMRIFMMPGLEDL